MAGASSEVLERVVRPAGEDDLPGVAELYRRWVDEGITLGLVADDVAALRAKLGPGFLVAERDGALVGFATARVRRAAPGDLFVFPAGGDYVEVEDLYVAPGARSAGLGTRLLDALLQATDTGTGRSVVFTATKAVGRIVRFYERLGYQPWGVQLYRTAGGDNDGPAS